MSSKSNFNFPPDQWGIPQGEWGVDFWEDTGTLEITPGISGPPLDPNFYIVPLTAGYTIVVEKEAGVAPAPALLQSDVIPLKADTGRYVLRGDIFFQEGYSSGDLYIEFGPGFRIGVNPTQPTISEGAWSEIEIFRSGPITGEEFRITFGLFTAVGIVYPDQADSFVVAVDNLRVEKDPCLFAAKLAADQTISDSTEDGGVYTYASWVNFTELSTQRVSDPDHFYPFLTVPPSPSYYAIPLAGVYQFNALITLGNITVSGVFDIEVHIMSWDFMTGETPIVSVFVPGNQPSINKVTVPVSVTEDSEAIGRNIIVKVEIVTTDGSASFDILADNSHFSGFRINE